MSANKKKKDRRLKEQFMNGINDTDMMTEIRQLAVIKRTNEVTSKQVLNWIKRVETQESKKLY